MKKLTKKNDISFVVKLLGINLVRPLICNNKYWSETLVEKTVSCGFDQIAHISFELVSFSSETAVINEVKFWTVYEMSDDEGTFNFEYLVVPFIMIFRANLAEFSIGEISVDERDWKTTTDSFEKQKLKLYVWYL